MATVQRENSICDTYCDTYSKMSDDELLRLADQKDSLLPLGQEALTNEMRKRGMDEGAVARFRLSEEEATRQDNEGTTLAKQVRAKNGFKNIKRTGIFMTAAIVTDVLASNLFSLSGEATYLLTKMSLYLAFAASGLAWGYGGTWLTTRKTIALAAGLSACFLIWVLYIKAAK